MLIRLDIGGRALLLALPIGARGLRGRLHRLGGLLRPLGGTTRPLAEPFDVPSLLEEEERENREPDEGNDGQDWGDRLKGVHGALPGTRDLPVPAHLMAGTKGQA